MSQRDDLIANYNPVEARRKRIKYAYGLTPDDYDALLVSQNGACAICLETPERFHIDHCHVTGKVRGLLCSLCNTSLGGFKDNKEALQRAINYLGQ